MRLIGLMQTVLEVVIPVVGIVAILDIPLYLTNTSLFNQQYLALFWGLASALIFITVPASKKGTAKAVSNSRPASNAQAVRSRCCPLAVVAGCRVMALR